MSDAIQFVWMVAWVLFGAMDAWIIHCYFGEKKWEWKNVIVYGMIIVGGPLLPVLAIVPAIALSLTSYILEEKKND